MTNNLLKKRLYNWQSLKALNQWLSVLKEIPQAEGRVLITALRNQTWIEWAVYCSAVFRKMGFESTILFKGTEIKKFYPECGIINFWKKARKIPGIEFVDLEKLKYNLNPHSEYINFSRMKAIAALAYEYHIESADILDNIVMYQNKLDELIKESVINGTRVFEYLTSMKFHQFICYSGIIGDTPMILKGALDAKQETVCVEGWAWRLGHMIYNFNEPALEYNVKGWMNHFGQWDEKKELDINNYFGFLDGFEQDEQWLKNFHLIQRSKINDELPIYIKEFLEGDQKIFLLPCNVIGDSSLLNRESIFRSQRYFVKEVIDHFKHRTDLKLIIRAHPGEIWVNQKVKIKMGEFAKKVSADFKNILVIDATDNLNTFTLVPFLHAAIVWITSAGVDLVARGIPVIAGAVPKYSGMGIVIEPETKTEFFKYLDKLALNKSKPSLMQIQKAKEYLYLIFKGFSFEAQGRTFRAASCRLGDMPMQEEHDNFYKILLKLIPAPDVTTNQSI